MNNYFAGDLRHDNDPAISEFIQIWDALPNHYQVRLLHEHDVSRWTERPKVDLLQKAPSIADLLLRARLLQAQAFDDATRRERKHARDSEARHIYHPFYGNGRADGYGN